jgi:hypothetical protein
MSKNVIMNETGVLSSCDFMTVQSVHAACDEGVQPSLCEG